MKFKVGDRVAVYDGSGRFTATILGVGQLGDKIAIMKSALEN